MDAWMIQGGEYEDKPSFLSKWMCHKVHKHSLEKITQIQYSAIKSSFG